MENKLDQFYSSAWTSGIARANRFEVFITPPSAKGFSEVNNSNLLRHMTIVCEAINIPSQTIATTESRINGLPVIPLPYSFSYTNQLELSFKLSEDYRERNFFLAWQDLVYKPGLGFSYYNEYVGTIVMRPMNTANVVKQEFVFRNCFPVTVQDLQYGWGSNNENLKQGVTMSFFSQEVRNIVTNIDSSLTNPFNSGIQQA